MELVKYIYLFLRKLTKLTIFFSRIIKDKNLWPGTLIWPKKSRSTDFLKHGSLSTCTERSHVDTSELLWTLQFSDSWNHCDGLGKTFPLRKRDYLMVVPMKCQKESGEDQLLGSLWKFLKDICHMLSLLLHLIFFFFKKLWLIFHIFD